MIIELFRYIPGYVDFEVNGEYPERLFNQLAAENIKTWNIHRKNQSISASVRAGNYLKIHSVRGKNKVRTRVTARHGLPFFLRKYRLRAGFVAGVVLFVFGLYFLSSFVWNIDFCGNTKLSDTELKAACDRLGLYEGVKISSLDTDSLRAKLALEFENIAWVSVNIEGSKATVNISESIGEKSEPLKPRNLVASRDGIIVALKVTKGSTAVSLGQTVTAGELLVSGFTEHKDGTFSIDAASGEVYAETERTLSCLAKYVQTEKIYTTEPIKRSVFSFFGLNVPLYFGSLKGNFETSVNTHRFESNSMYLPVSITEKTYRGVDVRAYEIDAESATALSDEMLCLLEAEELKGAEIISKNVTFEVTAKGVTATGKYICRENIAEEDLLLIYEEK